MLKIKVNIDKETYQKLILDMISFKIIKKDNTPNKKVHEFVIYKLLWRI